jgi:hypothetical protein
MASSEIRALDWDGQTGRHVDASSDPNIAARSPKIPLSTGLPAQADGGTRTPDPIITSDVLYQLSYVGAVGLDGSDRSGA